jgi:hypothetical protein
LRSAIPIPVPMPRAPFSVATFSAFSSSREPKAAS